jgi:hypothetical protein
MAEVKSLQHIYSSAERGYFPHQGRGFQTVALSTPLVGTEDLKTLERAAFYSVSAERRRANDLPVKETFFHLPSGAMAAGRITDAGMDSMGREGNYLAHHIIFSRDDFLAAGANPFALLDALPEENDLTPRELPPMTIEVSDDPIPHLPSPISHLAANLALAVADRRDKTVLMIGKEATTRNALLWLISSLAREERIEMTFSTHFYECHNLHSMFSVVAAGSRAEAPSQRQDYLIFDFDEGEFPRLAPASQYSAWLAECVRADERDEILALNQVLNELRHSDRVSLLPPASKRAVAALCEKAGMDAARAIAGDAGLIIEFLKHAPSPKEMADKLLALGSPSNLCGASEDAASECMLSLRAAASTKAWNRWTERWKSDPLLAQSSAVKQPWWRLRK